MKDAGDRCSDANDNLAFKRPDPAHLPHANLDFIVCDVFWSRLGGSENSQAIMLAPEPRMLNSRSSTYFTRPVIVLREQPGRWRHILTWLQIIFSIVVVELRTFISVSHYDVQS